jgi:hypothetical protein
MITPIEIGDKIYAGKKYLSGNLKDEFDTVKVYG